MSCSRCGADLPPHTAFCALCGAPATPPAPPWSGDDTLIRPHDAARPRPEGYILSPPPYAVPADTQLRSAGYPPPPRRTAPGSIPPRGPGKTPFVVVAVALVALAGAGTVFWFARADAALSARPGSTAATPRAVPTTDTTVTSTAPVASPPRSVAPGPSAAPRSTGTTGGEEAAVAALYSRSSSDAETVSFDGRWVAQLASKYVGITDPLQRADNGSHTFLARDIIAESDGLAARVSEARVVLLNSTTYGKRFSHDDEPLWVTMALSESFTSKGAVLRWCATQFPELAGDELSNQCMPNRLNP